ncbi:MAG: hypothetical protein SF052_22855 [Bacteroidia bacterium]|nr:hypothetical protein [Bacteroidia bacterium]
MKYLYILILSLLLGFSSYRLCMNPKNFSVNTCTEFAVTDSVKALLVYEPSQEEKKEENPYSSTDLSVVVLYAVFNFFLELYQ